MILRDNNLTMYYRYNPVKGCVEFWCNFDECWNKSVYKEVKSATELKALVRGWSGSYRFLTYSSTWAEPFEEMEK